jgi:hypothetical protein
MDFLAKFELSIIPSKQQVLHAASGRTFNKASTTPFISPWSPETVAVVTALLPQVTATARGIPVAAAPQRCPSQATPRVAHHIDTGSAAPMFARPRRLDPEKHRIAGETPHRRRGISRLGKSSYYSPLQLALGVLAAPGSQE